MALPTEEKEVPDKISDQAILMLKLSELAAYSAKQETIPIFPVQGKEPGDFIGYRRFNNLCVIDHEFPYSVPNLILSHQDETGAMLKLSTLQLSLLVPRIRIFKTVFDLNLEEELNIELPFDNVASKTDLESIYSSGQGRGTGVGLKSFEWKSLGKNQANLAQFSAKLNLFLLNIEEMQQVKNSKILDNGRVINVSVLDLLYQKPDLRSGINEGSNIYDAKYFGIKVEVGWHLDPKVFETFKTESRKHGDDPDYILSVVQKQKSIFYLTLSNHELNINGDGSIDLTIDYIASAEMDVADNVTANILKLNDEEERKLQDLLQRQKDVNKQINSFKISAQKTDEQLTKASNTYTPVGYSIQGYNQGGKLDATPVLTQEESQYKRLLDEKKNIQQDLESLKKNQRVSRITSIIKRMIDYDLINVLSIENKNLEILSNWRTQLVETDEDLSNLRQDFNTIKNNTKVIPVSTLDDSAMDTLKKISEQGNDDQKNILKFDEFTVGQKNDSTKFTNISFFFLGDLLNIVLEKIFDDDTTKVHNFINKTVRVMLAPITYYDFGSIEDNGIIVRTKGTRDSDGELVAVYKGKQSIVNIADIPISVREFSRWFAENIINKGKDTYSFLDFAKDIIDDLAIAAISAETFKFAPRQQVRINMLPFSAPKLPHNEDVFQSIIDTPDRLNIQSFRVTLGPNKSFGSKRSLLSFMNSNLKAEKQNYLLFYGTNQPPLDRIANQKRDLQEKIYHVFIGEERGLLKDAKFSRDDNPRQRAVNIQQSNPEKQGEGMVIREKYSANLTMFGNFLFSPGQQIYVHPTYPGLKGKNVRENIFRKLGLGGYYRVIETTNKISSGEFSTTVRTKWDAFGDGTLNIGDQLVGQVVEKQMLGREDFNSEQSIIDLPNRVKLVAE